MHVHVHLSTAARDGPWMLLFAGCHVVWSVIPARGPSTLAPYAKRSLVLTSLQQNANEKSLKKTLKVYKQKYMCLCSCFTKNLLCHYVFLDRLNDQPTHHNSPLSAKVTLELLPQKCCRYFYQLILEKLPAKQRNITKYMHIHNTVVIWYNTCCKISFICSVIRFCCCRISNIWSCSNICRYTTPFIKQNTKYVRSSN